MKVMPRDDSQNSHDDSSKQESSLIVSQIDLNPEDIILLKKFISV